MLQDLLWPTSAAAAVLLIIQIAGILHVVHALMHVRTSQGTVAWIVCLLTIPWLAIPFYWIAGRRRFTGYVHARRAKDQRFRAITEDMAKHLNQFELEPDDAFGRAAKILSGLPFTRGNRIELLIDGEQTFNSIFEAIGQCQDYLLVNFFILKDDETGQRFKEALIERAEAGVRVYLMFDEVGSRRLPNAYLRELREGKVNVCSFGGNRLWWSRLQMNFRNHRKIVVADGEFAYVGGLNVGDEYLGRGKRFKRWRDTHVKITGPSVEAVQLVFLEDWNWAIGKIPKVTWDSHAEEPNQTVAIIPTGPADPADSWQLIVAEAAAASRQRLWITSPYFVPDDGVLTALQAAALRGVDVKILIPEKADHLLVWLSAFTFYADVLPFGVKLMRYDRGFLHQKVMLVDDAYAFVGTANLDNRSFRLNFEITALSTDAKFITEVATMLEEDFSYAREVEEHEFDEKPFLFRLAARAARMAAPIQ